MANYLVRIELFEATADNYDRLHANMDALGIERTVRYSNGNLYQLPTGTYFGPSNLDTAALLAKIKAFATPQSPKKEPSIFLAQVNGSEWTSALYPA
ncbi:hypothetical protein PSH77_15170 [Pseudomonas extremorientalis]|uniref:hypothetical protein n=1 Tax=Pseudomonas extremorientalis TaxID=169669 RepID=UPI0027352030|nr:hypothetical protein [Pseudomonas extremorientalis]WLG54036.1 hypothetical protein PSH77_15170 [Pseudomonas extremorientalis]